jgi:hypothetical protein
MEKSVPVDLETIILKAVGKNPSDRYTSASDLAADLKRFLEDKPIQAKRPGLVQRFRKWSRRHPSAVVAGVILLVFGVIGFAVSTVIIAGAYARERQRAEEAEQRFNLARRSADEMIRIAQEDLVDKPHMQDVRRRLLEAALVYYQEFIEQRRDKPESQAELAVTRDLVKKILDDLAVLQGAGRHFLLKNPSVLDDLELSRSHRDQMADLLARMDGERHQLFESSHGQTPEERQNGLLEMIRSHDSAINTILTAGHQDRLRQIARQCQGPWAFQDSEVVQKLELTADQKRQIRSIEANVFADRTPIGRPDRPGPGQPGRWTPESRKAVMNQIMKVLTEEQTRRWDELTGKPFARAAEIFVPGPPGGFHLPPPPPRFDVLRPR